MKHFTFVSPASGIPRHLSTLKRIQDILQSSKPDLSDLYASILRSASPKPYATAQRGLAEGFEAYELIPGTYVQSRASHSLVINSSSKDPDMSFDNYQHIREVWNGYSRSSSCLMVTPRLGP